MIQICAQQGFALHNQNCTGNKQGAGCPLVVGNAVCAELPNSWLQPGEQRPALPSHTLSIFVIAEELGITKITAKQTEN